MTERGGAVLILEARTGDVNDARALVGEGIRKTLGVRRWGEPPHYVSYISKAECKSYNLQDPRYTISVTVAEFEALLDALHALAPKYGWAEAPIDAYHES